MEAMNINAEQELIKSGDDSHRRYILRELQKAKKEAQAPNAVWHSEDDVLKMLEG